MLYLPVRAKNPPESLPAATIILIAINVIVFFLTSDGAQIHEHIVRDHGSLPNEFVWSRTISAIFLHADLFHLIGNMWFLYLFGFAVEGRLKTLKFLIGYFVAGFAGDFLQRAANFSTGELNGIGASGATMGIMGMALFMFPYSLVELFYWFFFKAGIAIWHMRWIAVLYIGLDLVQGFAFMGDEVGHFAHLGGAGAGFLICYLFRPKRDARDVSHAKAIISQTSVLTGLTPDELKKLWHTNPHDYAILAQWYMAEVKESGSVSEECRELVRQKMTHLLDKIPLMDLGTILMGFVGQGLEVSNGALITVGVRLSETGNATQGIKLLEAVLRHEPTEDDAQAAVFRMSLIYENQFFDFKQAAKGYRHVLASFPMGAFAPQAEMRLRALERGGKA